MSAPQRSASADDVPSPCISVCVLDASGAYCLGCRRTLREIAAWMDMSADARRAVIDALPGRVADGEVR